MKRKVAHVNKVRLSPNEEAILVKHEYERRRKLRLQQVREQERCIALQIRQEVKQRKEEQMQKLAEQLKAEWLSAQAQRAALLEKMYVSSLEAVGQGHRQAKENEPDLKALNEKMAVCKQKAMVRHREALRELKFQKDKEKEEQTRYILARKHALLVEKERASKIASLPPPPPDPVDAIQVPKYPAVKLYDIDSFSVSHYHLPEPCVYRETNTEQTDARIAAEKEAQRLEGLKMEDERERREQMEKARLRGSHALRVVHLEQDRERLMKELEQMQHADLERRRQIVAQMPPQLFEPPYRRMEIKDDWQRELEFAFEDMYTGEKRVKGDLILRLEPHPLPSESVSTQDEDLDLSCQPETVENIERQSEDEQKEGMQSDKAEAAAVASQAPSKLALKKLLNKIRTQKDSWTSRSTESSDTMTIESGPFSSEEGSVMGIKQDAQKSAALQSLPSSSQECEVVTEDQIVAGNATLLHPKEQAILIRSVDEKQKQAIDIEKQTQEQLAVLQQLEDQKRRLEAHYQQIHSEQEQIQHSSKIIPRKDTEEQLHFSSQDAETISEQRVQQTGLIQTSEEGGVRASASQVPSTMILPADAVAQQENVTFSENGNEDDNHLQTIHQYQQHLLEQNRLHKQSIEIARKQLREYQMFLKKRYTSVAGLPTESSAYNKLKDGLSSSVAVHFEAPVSQSRTTAFIPGVCVSASQKEKTFPAYIERLDNLPVRAAVSSIAQPKLGIAESEFTSLQKCPCQSNEKEQNQELRNMVLKQHADNAEFQNTSDIVNGKDDAKRKVVVGGSGENRVRITSSHKETLFQPGDTCDALKNSGSMTQEFFSELQADLQAKQFGRKHEKYAVTEPPNLPSRVAVQATSKQGAVFQSQQNLTVTSSRPLAGMFLDQEMKQMKSVKMLDVVLPPGEGHTEMTSFVPAQTRQTSADWFHSNPVALSLPDHQGLDAQMVKDSSLDSRHCQQKSCAAAERGPLGMTAEEHRMFSLHQQGNMDVYSHMPGMLAPRRTTERQEVISSTSNFVSLQPQQNLIASSLEMEARQKQIRSLQEQLEREHGSILARQKLQEEMLLCRPDNLKELIRKQQASLDDILLGNQTEESRTACIQSSIQSTRQHDLMSSLLEALEESSEDSLAQKRNEECGHLNTDDLDEWRVSFEHSDNYNHSDDFQRIVGRGQQHNRKPPVTKTKLGLMGVLEQHELSVIPEVETPSERLSILGRPDVTTEGDSSAAEAEFESSKLEHFSSIRDLNLSRISTSSRETLTESIKDDSSSVRLTWRERLKLDASSPLEKDMPIHTVSDLPSYSADVGKGVVTYPGPPFWNSADEVKAWQGALFETSQNQKLAEAEVFSSTTLSTGTLSTTDQPDFSTSSSETVPCIKDGLVKCTLSSELAVNSSSTTTTSSFLPYQVFPTSSFSRPAAVEEYIPNSSHIQEIIDKYTKDLCQAVDTNAEFHVPLSGTDITDLDDSQFYPLQLSQHSSTQLFHSLTPKADFDISSSYSQISEGIINSRDTKDHNKTVDPSTSAHTEIRGSVLHEFECSMHSLPRSTIQDSPASETEGFRQQLSNADQSSNSFHPLQPEVNVGECSLGTELHVVTELANAFHQSTMTNSQLQTTSEFLAPAFEMTNESLLSTSEVLMGLMESRSDRGSESTIENPRSQSAQTLLQDSGSFDQLNATPSTVNDSKCSFREGMEETKMDFSFAEQPIVILGRGENEQDDEVITAPNAASCSKDSTAKTNRPEFIPDIAVEQQKQAPQTLPRTVSEKAVEWIESSMQKITLHGNSVMEPAMEKSAELASRDHFASWMNHSSFPVWETETGKGIMEESELTLVSLSDSTVVDQENADGLKNEGNDTVHGSEDPEFKMCSTRCGYQSSEAVTDQSIKVVHGSSTVSGSLCDEQLKQSVVMLLEFESQGSLQEAFLKKKGDFIQKCSKRVEQIKNKPSLSRQVKKTVKKTTEKSGFPQKVHSSSSATVELKKVGEVKVSTPEDRKSAAAEMQQRTLRLYNQLSEVKQKKQEKTRREVYACNREKAKEFQKKTLEKLRVKKMH